jgi:hypothetical protein
VFGEGLSGWRTRRRRRRDSRCNDWRSKRTMRPRPRCQAVVGRTGGSRSQRNTFECCFWWKTVPKTSCVQKKYAIRLHLQPVQICRLETPPLPFPLFDYTEGRRWQSRCSFCIYRASVESQRASQRPRRAWDATRTSQEGIITCSQQTSTLSFGARREEL